jgi:hypothetical protein
VIDGFTGNQRDFAGPVGVGGVDWQVGGKDFSPLNIMKVI